MRRSDIAAALAVPLAVGLLLIPAGAPQPETTAATAQRVPVKDTTLVCPPLDSGSTRAQSASAAVTSTRLPHPANLAESPVRLRSGRTGVGKVSRRGSTWTGGAPAVAKGLEATASGGLAAGLEAGVSGTFDDAERGLATGRCSQPAAHWWFAGAASTTDRSAVLHLANPTPGVAVADLTFYGPKGPVDASAGSGIALQPGQSRSVPLADLVPGAGAVTVEVTAHQGQVAASMTEVARNVLDPAGVDLVPPAAEPSRSTALTGVPAGPGHHVLSVANAGSSAAVAQVEVLGPRGAYTPTAVESLRVPAQGVAEARLPASVFDGDAGGIRLHADQPVTAAVRTTSGSPATDQSFAVAGEPLGSGAAAPLLPGLDGKLVLSSAGSSAVTVDLTMTSASGRRVGRRTVDVQRGQTRAVDLGGKRAAAVSLRGSGRGPLLAAVQWSKADSGGTLSSGFPLMPLRATILRPPVTYDLTDR